MTPSYHSLFPLKFPAAGPITRAQGPAMTQPNCEGWCVTEECWQCWYRVNYPERQIGKRLLKRKEIKRKERNES